MKDKTDAIKSNRTRAAVEAHVDTLKFLMEAFPVNVQFNGSLCIAEEATRTEYIEIGLTLFEVNKTGTCAYNFALGDWWIQANTGYGERLQLLIEMFGEKQAPIMLRMFMKLAVVARQWPPSKRNLLYSWTWYRTHKPGEDGGQVVDIGGSSGAFPSAGEPYVMGQDAGGNVIPNAYLVFKPEAAIVNIGSRRVLFPRKETRKAIHAAQWQESLDID